MSASGGSSIVLPLWPGGADVTAIALRINGNCAVLNQQPAALPADASQTACNARYRAAAAQTQRRHRPSYFRPCLSQNPLERIPQLEALLADARRSAGR